jgi:hypothetical protein
MLPDRAAATVSAVMLEFRPGSSFDCREVIIEADNTNRAAQRGKRDAGYKAIAEICAGCARVEPE